MADSEQQRQFVIVQFTVEAALALRLRRRDRYQFVGDTEVACFMPQQVEGTIARHDGEPRFGPRRKPVERP